jgi:UDP-2,4-diacetamido-2,4,6-trideoxy-beta-L-altropyranose hydrolase
LRRPVVIFRTKGGATVGLGHLRRYLTLALELEKNGVAVHFVVNREPLVREFVGAYGFDVVAVGESNDFDLHETLNIIQWWGADVLVVDSYDVPGGCLEKVMGTVLITVIDDLADRPLPVDLVINGGIGASKLEYRALPRTEFLLRPRYVLLREEFALEPKRQFRHPIKQVLITVGGMDGFSLTPQLIDWTREALGTVAIDVVVGPFFSRDSAGRSEALAKRDGPVAVHRDPSDIHKLMMACDLTITGGGQTTCELAVTGTPAVAIRLLDNQTGNLSAVSAKGVLTWVGDVHDCDLREKVVQALVALSSDLDRRKAMSHCGRQLVDGFGAKRVAKAMLTASRANSK